jgi:hypothetical protein
MLKGQNWPIDFNGDGWEEFVGAQPVYPTNAGSIIFFETGSTDTLPTYHMLSDTSMPYYFQVTISSVFQQFADIDGDGCTDISMEYRPMNIPDKEFRKFYYGNSAFAFSDTFKIIDTTHIISIPDMNGDSKGELITLNYGSHLSLLVHNSDFVWHKTSKSSDRCRVKSSKQFIYLHHFAGRCNTMMDSMI